jgi:O-antigen ligase
VSGFVRYVQLFVIVPLAIVVAVREPRDQRLVCGAVLAAAVMEGALGTWQVLTGTGASFAGHNVRAVGTFGAQDVMGMSTVVGYGLIVALGLALVLRGRSRAALLALAALLVMPLLLSLSRGAVIATIGAVAMMLLATSPRLAVRTAVFGGAAAIVLFGVLGTATTVGARLVTIGTSLTGPDRSVGDRYGLWSTAIAMWRDHPVTGVGVKMFPAYRDAYAPMHLSSGSDVADPGLGFRREPLLSPHDMYLLVLSEQGLLGATAFAGLLMALLVLTFRRTWQVAGLAGMPDGRLPGGHLIGSVSVGVVGWMLLNFISSDIGGPPTVLVPVMMGLAVSWAAQPAVGAGWDLER